MRPIVEGFKEGLDDKEVSPSERAAVNAGRGDIGGSDGGGGGD